MRLPRMTVRRWMVLIGLCAVIMAATVYQRRRESWKAYCLDRQRYNARWEAEYRRISVGLAQDAVEYTKKLEAQDLPEAKRKRLRYLVKQRSRSTKSTAELSEFYRRMRVKWEHGVSNLWLWAEPDPPFPD
jgi:hypothetical protein